MSTEKEVKDLVAAIHDCMNRYAEYYAGALNERRSSEPVCPGEADRLQQLADMEHCYIAENISKLKLIRPDIGTDIDKQVGDWLEELYSGHK